MNNVTDWQGGENEPVGCREGSVEFKINTSQRPGNKTGIILEGTEGIIVLCRVADPCSF